MISPGSQHDLSLVYIIFHLLCPLGPWVLILGPRQLLGRQVVPVRGPKVLGSFGIYIYICMHGHDRVCDQMIRRQDIICIYIYM